MMSNYNIPKFASELKLFLSQQNQAIDKDSRIIGAIKVYDHVYNGIEDYMNCAYRPSYQKLLLTIINRIKINEIENNNIIGADPNIQNQLTISMNKCKPVLKKLFIQCVFNSPEYNNYDDFYKNMYSSCIDYLNISQLRRSTRNKNLKYPNFIDMDDEMKKSNKNKTTHKGLSSKGLKIIREQKKHIKLIAADLIVLARRSSRLAAKPKINYNEL